MVLVHRFTFGLFSVQRIPTLSKPNPTAWLRGQGNTDEVGPGLNWRVACIGVPRIDGSVLLRHFL